MDHLCYLCLVFVMLSRLFIAALWPPEEKRLVCDDYCDFVTFPFGILGQVWYLIVSIPDLCCLSYFYISGQGSVLPVCMVALPCFLFEISPMNENHRGNLTRS